MGIVLHHEAAEGVVCRLAFEGSWTLQNLKALGDEIDQYLLARGPGVVILDMTRGNAIPDRLVDHVALFSTPPDPMLASVTLFVVVGSSCAGRLLFNSFSRLFRNNTLTHRTVFVDTLEDAWQVIEAQHAL